MALAMAVTVVGAAAGEWRGLGLLSGSSINDIMITTALTMFCSQCSPGPENWNILLRRELPELTDGDIEWLCGLTEAMELHEPASSLVEPNLPPKKKAKTDGSRRRGRRPKEPMYTASESHCGRNHLSFSRI